MKILLPGIVFSFREVHQIYIPPTRYQWSWCNVLLQVISLVRDSTESQPLGSCGHFGLTPPLWNGTEISIFISLKTCFDELDLILFLIFWLWWVCERTKRVKHRTWWLRTYSNVKQQHRRESRGIHNYFELTISRNNRKIRLYVDIILFTHSLIPVYHSPFWLISHLGTSIDSFIFRLEYF